MPTISERRTIRFRVSSSELCTRTRHELGALHAPLRGVAVLAMGHVTYLKNFVSYDVPLRHDALPEVGTCAASSRAPSTATMCSLLPEAKQQAELPRLKHVGVSAARSGTGYFDDIDDSGKNAVGQPLCVRNLDLQGVAKPA